MQGPTALLVDPVNAGTIGINSLNKRGHIDVSFQATSGDELDVDSLLDDAAEFTLTNNGQLIGFVPGVKPERLEGTNTFRYFLDGQFTAGEVTVEFIANSFQSVTLDQSGFDADGIGNLTMRHTLLYSS